MAGEKMITLHGCTGCPVFADCLRNLWGLCNMKDLRVRAIENGERPRSKSNGRWTGEM